MRSPGPLLCIVISAICCRLSSGFVVCGDNEYDYQVDCAITEIVERFIGKWEPEKAWRELSTITTMMVATPQNVSSSMKQKAIKKIEAYASAKGKRRTIRELAELTIAAKSLCLNVRNVAGVDLVAKMVKRLKNQFPQGRSIPRDGYWMFSIGIASLCITGYPIPPVLVNKFSRGQNNDGSFCYDDPVGDTIALVPAIQCLGQMQHPLFNSTLVQRSVEKMRRYVISMFQDRKSTMYSHHSNLMELALIGLWKTKRKHEDPEKWHCSEACGIIGSHPKAAQSEQDLGLRLMRLTGTAYMDIGQPDYKCTGRG